MNSPVYHDDGIKTEKKAFSKIMYLDNPSSISIYPETKISIMGEINGEFIDKGINMDQGIIKVNIAANEFGNTFTIVTPYSKVHCKECNSPDELRVTDWQLLQHRQYHQSHLR